jgi:hypothetical protein
VLVFAMGAFAEISGDVSRICGIIAHEQAMPTDEDGQNKAP